MRTILNRIMTEEQQGHQLRIKLYKSIESTIGKPVVSFFTSFEYPVSIDGKDADVLESILQQTNLERGLILMINSPGGDGLAAERIVKICRAYSGTGDYWAIAPSRSKSAATMICFGASKIIMSKTSELGPVDPQYPIEVGGKTRWMAAHNIVTSYTELFDQSLKSSGHIEPYLQQLARFDYREIKSLQQAIALASDISIRNLHSGMLSDIKVEDIEKQIRMFLSPEITKSHGRAIYAHEAKNCGLHVQTVDHKDKLWQDVYELYIRLSRLVNSKVSKCIETKDHSFVSGIPN